MDIGIILGALRKHYSGEIESIELSPDGGQASYLVFGGDEKYLLKIVNDDFLNMVKSSVDIIRYLQRYSFRTPGLINTADGQSFAWVEDSGIKYLFVMFEFIDGIQPNVLERAADFGRLTGSLHMKMQNFAVTLPVRRKEYFIDRYIDILREKGYSKEKTEEYVKIGNELWDRVKDLPSGYCHGNLQSENLLLTAENKLYIKNFDTSCYAPRMFDITLMCDVTNYYEFDPKDKDAAAAVFKQFLKGYSEYIGLPDQELCAFYDFIAIRHYQLQADLVEKNGMDCIDEAFMDKQLHWLQSFTALYTPAAKPQYAKIDWTMTEGERIR